MALLEQFLYWVHGLSAAAWFGAIFYRTAVVDLKAYWFFRDPRDYERYSTHLAHGMRHLVTAGLLTCGLSGFALVGLKWEGASPGWSTLMVLKAAVWLAACGLFTYVSWVHWPWRSLAAPPEFASYRRQGMILAAAMVVLAGTGFALGQACRLTRADRPVPAKDAKNATLGVAMWHSWSGQNDHDICRNCQMINMMRPHDGVRSPL